jgi:tRNA dimethylallyltransferase
MSQAVQPAVIAIVGPTASGKSALALRVTQAVDAEIVSTDSMQAYRGMNIGTAKPSEVDQRLVRHHMIDVWPVDLAVSVVEFRDMARQAIDDVRERGKTALVVGGSGLYVRAVLEKLDFPGTDPNARARWETRLSEVGAPALHDELHAIDPDAAQAIERNNGRRIVRALEVIELTGEPFVARLPPPEDVYPVHRFGVHIDRERLDTSIEDRVDAMWKDGFVDEVRRLEGDGFRDAPTAAAALGYGPVLVFLAGECSEEQARQRTIDDTRKFARRQQRWFLRDERIEWRDHDDADFADAIAGCVARP